MMQFQRKNDAVIIAQTALKNNATASKFIKKQRKKQK